MSRPIVLCYHALSERWPATLCVTPDMFERQIDLMVSRGFRGTTFSGAVQGQSASKTFAVTFDDAFRSVLTRALPILDRYELPATVFAVTRFAESGEPLCWDGIDQWQGSPYDEELAGMGWGELRELRDRGWEIGSHTASHPHLPSLPDASLTREVVDSKAACEAGLGEPCASIAYPYGDVDARVVEAARDAGYVTGAALPQRVRPERDMEWPRVGVWFNDDLHRFKLKVSRAVWLLRRVARR